MHTAKTDAKRYLSSEINVQLSGISPKASLSGALQTESGALSVSPLDPPYSVGLPVVTTNSFSVEVPELDETSVDFGLLVDVSGSYRCALGTDILSLPF